MDRGRRMSKAHRHATTRHASSWRASAAIDGHRVRPNPLKKRPTCGRPPEETMNDHYDALLTRFSTGNEPPLLMVVGLGQGELLEAMERRGMATRVLAIEPVPSILGELRRPPRLDAVARNRPPHAAGRSRIQRRDRRLEAARQGGRHAADDRLARTRARVSRRCGGREGAGQADCPRREIERGSQAAVRRPLSVEHAEERRRGHLRGRRRRARECVFQAFPPW